MVDTVANSQVVLTEPPTSASVPAATRPAWVGRWSSWIPLITLCGCYYLLGNEWDRPLEYEELFIPDAGELESQAEAGRNIWRVAFLGIGCVGAGLLLWPAGPAIRPRRPLAWCMLATVGWCTASLLWSDVPDITVRRLVTLYCVFLGAVGFARYYSPMTIPVLGVVHTSLVLVVSLLSEMTHGTLSPLDAEYRFAGTLHPNAQAINCTVLALGAAILLRVSARRHRGWWWSLLITSLVFLLMTRSRTALGGCLLAFLAMWWLEASARFKLASVVMGAALAGGIAIAMLMSDWTDPDDWMQLALLGRRDDQRETLSGRIPIWEFGWRDLQERPLTGYGFNSYWTDEKLLDAHQELEWALAHVHNAYLETMLSIGAIGLTLVLLSIGLGIRNTAELRRRTGNVGYSFVFSLAVFGIVNGFFESQMLVPFSFAPFLVGCGFVHCAFIE